MPLDQDPSGPHSGKASQPPASHATLPNPTDAYGTTVTLPTGNTLGSPFYYYSGQLSTSTDENGNSGYAHFDSFGRPSSSYGPSLPIAGSPSPGNANPWTLIQYTSSTQVDTFTDINDTSPTPLTSCPSSNSCRQSEAKVDGLGRAIHSYLISDPEGQTEVDTVYDALGRVLSGSHPYRSTSDGTYRVETPSYDALGRTLKVTHPNNTYSQTSYGAAISGTGVNTAQLCSSSTYGLGFPVLAIDEAGKKREVWTDALTRPIQAPEPHTPVP